MIQKFRAQLTFALMSFIAKQLRAAKEAQPQEDTEDNTSRPTFQGGAVFKETELAGWEESTEKAVFVGRIRRFFRVVRESDLANTSQPR